MNTTLRSVLALAWIAPLAACGGESEDTSSPDGSSSIDSGVPDTTDVNTIPDAAYGPQFCTKDEDCTMYYGSSCDDCWCDLAQNTCRLPPLDASPAQDVKTDCQPLDHYGPQPCDRDDECVSIHGEGWVCDKTNTIHDPCDGELSWPMCVPDLDAGVPTDVPLDCNPATFYGPTPVRCEDDVQCVEQNGPGYVCDKAAGYTDPCLGWVSSPACVPESIDAGEPIDAVSEEPMAYYGPTPCDDGGCR